MAKNYRLKKQKDKLRKRESRESVIFITHNDIGICNS